MHAAQQEALLNIKKIEEILPAQQERPFWVELREPLMTKGKQIFGMCFLLVMFDTMRNGDDSNVMLIARWFMG